MVKRILLIVFFIFLISFFFFPTVQAQCSICTRTAQQLGEKPARGLNAGILYLAFMPLILIGFIAFKWWRRQRPID